MGEYLHCAPGQQLPLVLGARDLQLSTAFGAASPGGLPAGAADTYDTLSPQPPAEAPPDAPILSVAPRTKSRLQFESLAASLAAAELSQPAPPISAAAPPPAPSDALKSYHRSPSPKQMLMRQKTSSQREVALLHIYQVGPRDLNHQ